MKSIPSSIALVLLLASVSANPEAPAGEPKPGKKPDPGKEIAPVPADGALAAMARFRGKPGKPSTNVMTATRSDGLPDLKVAALAPATDGLTASEAPRFWWVQSHDTRGGELEFVLTALGRAGPAEVFRSPVPPMKAGYNHIDLANPRANPGRHTLEAGREYQWAINVRSERGAKPVYCRVKRAPAEAADPAADVNERIRVLSESGIWYELFDLAAAKARQGDPAWLEARDAMVASIGLADAVKP